MSEVESTVKEFVSFLEKRIVQGADIVVKADLCADAIKQILGINTSLRAQLAEARKENEELKTHAYAVAKELRAKLNEQDSSWQETAQHLLERAERAIEAMETKSLTIKIICKRIRNEK